jgi:hypothetical protein
MKRQQPIILAVIVAVTVAFVGMAFVLVSSFSTETPDKQVQKYSEAIYSRDFSRAYSLTTMRFQQTIPQEVFSKALQDALDSPLPLPTPAIASVEQISEREVVVHLTGTLIIDGAQKTLADKIRVKKEGGKWRIDPDIGRFASSFVRYSAPVSSKVINDVSVAVGPFVLRDTAEGLSSVEMRTVIQNSSTQVLVFYPPYEGTLDSYVRDDLGNIYTFLGGAGLLKNIGSQAALVRDTSHPAGVRIIVGPGETVSVFLRWTLRGVEPGKVDIVLSGFEFQGSARPWSYEFRGVPFKFLKANPERLQARPEPTRTPTPSREQWGIPPALQPIVTPRPEKITDLAPQVSERCKWAVIVLHSDGTFERFLLPSWFTLSDVPVEPGDLIFDWVPSRAQIEGTRPGRKYHEAQRCPSP